MTTARPDDSRLPYIQIVDELRSAIANGTITPGDKLPSNAELKRKYGVASQTAQNAINVLKSDGLVYGVAGRGVFVRTDIDVEALRRAIVRKDDSGEQPIGEVLAVLSEMNSKIEALEKRVDELEEIAGQPPREVVVGHPKRGSSEPKP